MSPRIGMYLLLVVLLAGSFWLKRSLRESPVEPSTDSTLEYAMRELTLISTDARGQPQLHLQATRLRKQSDTRWLLLEQPEIRLSNGKRHTETHTPPGWAWTIHAQRGRLADDGSQVLLQGNVQITQLNTSPALEMHTESLRYDTGKRIAQGQEPVQMRHGGLNLLGHSLWADLRAQQVKLEQGVEGQYRAP